MSYQRWRSLADKYSLIHGVPPEVILAVIQTESSGNPDAYNADDRGGGSRGLRQVTLATARGLGFTGAVSQLFDADTNVNLGTKLLADLLRKNSFDFRAMYSAYNSGSPVAYLSSSQVRNNVSRFERNLEIARLDVQQVPFQAASPAASGVSLLVVPAIALVAGVK